MSLQIKLMGTPSPVSKKDLCDISSVGRAIPCQGIGHRFEPDMSLQFKLMGTPSPVSKKIYATLAQLVERYLAKV